MISRRDAAERSEAQERRSNTSRDVHQRRMGTGRDARERGNMAERHR